MKRRLAPPPPPLPPTNPLPRLSFTIEDAAEVIGVSRSTMYELVRDGRVRTVHISERKRVIPLVELERFLALAG